MKKNIFENIAAWINGREDKGATTKKEKIQTEPSADVSHIFSGSVSNAIEKEEELIKAVKSVLNANYRGQECRFDDKVLSVCILDNLFYDSLKKDNFAGQLQTVVYDELGYAFKNVRIISGPLHENETYSKVSEHVFMQVASVNNNPVARKALVLSVAGLGSTLEESYFLDSEAIRAYAGERYNIGAGKHPKMNDCGHRENFIAIDDNPASPDFDKNKYASRSHAYISYNEEHGFLLNVEFGGTRMAGKRTHIYRGNEKIELDNALVPKQLKDGDYIVLSKNVHLLFKEI